MNTTDNKQILVGTRLGAMILDHIIMVMFMMPFYIPAMISDFFDAFNVSHKQAHTTIFSGPLGYIAIFGFSLYFCKDIVNGRSFAKRILKLQVNYIADDDSYNQLHAISTDLIYSKFPKETCTGQIKYIYQGTGQFQSKSTTFGTYIQPKAKK